MPGYIATLIIICALAASEPSLDLAQLVTRSVATSPALEAKRLENDAAEQAISQAGVWPDPVIALEYSNMPVLAPWPGNHPMSGVQLKLQQTIPFPGKTALRREVAMARAAQIAPAVAEQQNLLIGRLRQLHHRLSLVRQLDTLTRRHISLIEGFITVARARYEVGQLGQHDLLNLQLLEDKLTDDLDELARQEQELMAALNAAAHREPMAPIHTEEEVASPELDRSLERWIERAIASRPLLRQLQLQGRTEEAAAQRSSTERLPDLTAWAGYRMRAPTGIDRGDNFITVGVAAPLPWLWNDARWGAQEEAHSALARRAEQSRAATVDTLRAELAAALAGYERSLRKAERYQAKLIPDARRALDATLAAYQVGRADFATLYQAELKLLELEREQRRARSEAALAATAVETLAGIYAAPLTPAEEPS